MKIRTLRFLPALCLALPLVLIGSPASAADAHDHGDAPATVLTLDHGSKWATDEPLRLAMGNLHRSVAQALPAAHEGTLTDAQYDALSAQAGREVAYVVENCKLSPQADAVLHVVLADVVRGIDVAGGKQAGQPRAAGVVQLARALNQYGEYFNHPGWQAVGIPH